jgi:hypothetical protein
LKLRLDDVKLVLACKGFSGVDNPISQFDQFTNLIKEFQEATNRPPDGILSVKIFHQLVHELRESQSAPVIANFYNARQSSTVELGSRRGSHSKKHDSSSALLDISKQV